LGPVGNKRDRRANRLATGIASDGHGLATLQPADDRLRNVDTYLDVGRRQQADHGASRRNEIADNVIRVVNAARLRRNDCPLRQVPVALRCATSASSLLSFIRTSSSAASLMKPDRNSDSWRLRFAADSSRAACAWRSCSATVSTSGGLLPVLIFSSRASAPRSCSSACRRAAISFSRSST